MMKVTTRLTIVACALSLVACGSEKSREGLNPSAKSATTSATTSSGGPGAVGGGGNDATGSGGRGGIGASGGAGGAFPSTCTEPRSAAALPTGLGWHRLQGTAMASLCPAEPSIAGATGCSAVIDAWNGGIADTCRNRLLFWGGGHNDYYGNEIYALDLAADPPTTVRLTEPSVPPGSCTAAAPDGTATSRHTYNGLAYVTHADAMYVVGGATACPNGLEGQDTWTFDLSGQTWTRKDPTDGGPPYNSYNGKISAYDTVSEQVYLSDAVSFWRYDLLANRYAELQPIPSIDLTGSSGAIDPGRRLFLFLGDSALLAYNLDDDTIVDWSGASGCAPIRDAYAPGLAFDASRGLFVAWIGGDSVHLFNPDTMACSEVVHPGGPTPASNGTYGRFRYFPEPNAFAVVNNWQEDAFVLRLAP